jgi:hypothetical protein
MIPAMSTSMVLPPYVGDEPGDPAMMSPYPATMAEVVQRFAFSRERISILRGLLSYRSELRALGLDDGHQWLDGSFVEDVENIRKRPPRDIDIVTFASLQGTPIEKRAFIQANINLFDPELAKLTYLCDAYFVDLTIRPLLLVSSTRYWFGMFSHQRETSLWKGMLQVPIVSDDDVAAKLLDMFELNLGA